MHNVEEGCTGYIYLIIFNLESGKRRAGGGEILSLQCHRDMRFTFGSFSAILFHNHICLYISKSHRKTKGNKEREREKQYI